MSDISNRVKSMTTWLDYLRENPADDFDSVMELRIPMSIQLEIMRKAQELEVLPLDVVLYALADYGIARDKILCL